MDTCWYCGEDIEFRYVDGRCVPMHISGNWCEGYAADSTSTIIGSVETITNDPNISDRLWTPWKAGHARSDLCVPLTYPTICPVCDADIFFHTNGNGDVVFFDELGWPWPKHECLSTEDGIREASNSSSVNTLQLKKIAQLRVQPNSLITSRNQNVNEFDKQKIGSLMRGVVIRFQKKKGYRDIPGSYMKKCIEILSVVLQVASAHIRIYLTGSSVIAAGQILEMALEDILIDGRHVLFAQQFKVIVPSEEMTSDNSGLHC